MLALLQRINKSCISLVHKKGIELFLLPVHDCLLYYKLALFNQLKISFCDNKKAPSEKREHLVLVKKVLLVARKVIFQEHRLRDIPLSYLLLLKKRTNYVSRENQERGELKAVVVDAANDK